MTIILNGESVSLYTSIAVSVYFVFMMISASYGIRTGEVQPEQINTVRRLFIYLPAVFTVGLLSRFIF